MQNPCNRIHNKWVIREDDLTNETPINTCTTGKHSLRMLDNCVMYIYWLISLLFTARNSNLILRMGSFRPRRELVAPWSINLFHFKSSVLPRSSELILPCDDANFKQRKQRMAWLLLTSLDTPQCHQEIFLFYLLGKISQLQGGNCVTSLILPITH